MDEFRDDQPIWRQLIDRAQALILDGELGEGEALPSVRQIAAEMKVNPLTVSRAWQALEDQGVVEKRRGLGMYVAEGARGRLLEAERRRFLADEWPRLRARLERLQITLNDLYGDHPVQT